MAKKAISPVIATVIIVAVTIAIAIAVALWMSGLVGSFTQTENLQIISAYAEQTTVGNGTGWKITVQVKNTGTTDATIDNLFINGKPVSSYGGSITVSPDVTSSTISVKSGSTTTITVTIGPNAGFSSGQMVEVKIHTASGKEYPRQVTLP